MCAKLRCSMVAPGRSLLSGLIEIDKTELVRRSKHDPASGGGRRSHQGKILVVGAVEVADGGAGPGRIRLSQIADYSADSLHASISPRRHRQKPMAGRGIPAPRRHPRAHVIDKMAAHIVPPWVHRVFSNLKVWTLGVYHGLRRKHLQGYLDEFVFRFNRRRTLTILDLAGSKGISLWH